MFDFNYRSCSGDTPTLKRQKVTFTILNILTIGYIVYEMYLAREPDFRMTESDIIIYSVGNVPGLVIPEFLQTQY